MEGRPLNALILDDRADGALLIVLALAEQGFAALWERAWTERGMRTHLEAQRWDVVLARHTLPGFDATTALRILRDMEQDLPFIVISGAVDEESAVAVMRAGAPDYLAKDNLARLRAAIERAIGSAQTRADARAAAARVRHLNAVLRAVRNVNQLIVRERRPAQILQRTCDELVDTRGYAGAWIALTEEDGPFGRLVAERGYGEAFAPTRQRLEQGSMPHCLERAGGGGGVLVVTDPARACPTDGPAAPGAAAAAGADGPGGRTMMAPITSPGRTHGILCVQVPAGLDVDAEEASLLQEVAGDIGFALRGIATEEEQRTEEERYRQTFDTASVGIMLTAPDGTLTRVNQTFCDLVGYTRAEAEVMDFAALTHPDDLAISQEAVRTLLAGEQTACRFEKRYLSKDRGPVWTEISAALVRSPEGRPVNFVTHILDISRRKRAEEALRQEQALLLDVASNYPNSYVSLIDRLMNVAFTAGQGYANEGLSPCDYEGLSPEQIFGKAAGLVKEHYLRTFEGHECTFELEVRGQQQLIRTVPLRSARGEIDRILVVAEDVTERKRWQAQLAQSDRLASMGMLAAGVAHEINNPLSYLLYNLESVADDLPRLASAMRTCLDVATERVGAEEWARLTRPDADCLHPAAMEDLRTRAGDALQGAQRIKEIVRGLGVFSRVDRDRAVPVVLHQVIEVAINMVFHEIKYRARLVKSYGKTATLLANDGRLSQVFLNLLVNACHAIPEGAVDDNEIGVRTWQEGDEVCAEIRDTGGGVAAEHLAQLFEPFFTTKEIGVGTGLGLPISKAIVEEYGGRIQMESEFGSGTRVTVRLPTRRAVPRADGATGALKASRTEPGGRILVVDDDATIRKAIGRILRAHTVVEAGSGAEARATLEADAAFDVILCDVMMPAMSGVELHEWLATTRPALAEQVVFMTGGAFTPRARDYLATVGNLRLEKPVDVEHLRDVVSAMIRSSRRSRSAT